MSEYGAGFLPIRICGSCGMTEEGWYFIVLKSDSPTPIERDALYRMRQGLMLQDGHTGPLLRKETTIKELVTEWYNKDKQNG